MSDSVFEMALHVELPVVAVIHVAGFRPERLFVPIRESMRKATLRTGSNWDYHLKVDA